MFTLDVFSVLFVGVGGGLEVRKVRGESIRVDWTEFQIIRSRETPENRSNSFPTIFQLLARLPFFILSPEAPDHIFGKIPKKCAPGKKR